MSTSAGGATENGSARVCVLGSSSLRLYAWMCERPRCVCVTHLRGACGAPRYSFHVFVSVRLQMSRVCRFVLASPSVGLRCVFHSIYILYMPCVRLAACLSFIIIVRCASAGIGIGWTAAAALDTRWASGQHMAHRKRGRRRTCCVYACGQAIVSRAKERRLFSAAGILNWKGEQRHNGDDVDRHVLAFPRALRTTLTHRRALID